MSKLRKKKNYIFFLFVFQVIYSRFYFVVFLFVCSSLFLLFYFPHNCRTIKCFYCKIVCESVFTTLNQRDAHQHMHPLYLLHLHCAPFHFIWLVSFRFVSYHFVTFSPHQKGFCGFWVRFSFVCTGIDKTNIVVGRGRVYRSGSFCFLFFSFFFSIFNQNLYCLRWLDVCQKPRKKNRPLFFICSWFKYLFKSTIFFES